MTRIVLPFFRIVELNMCFAHSTFYVDGTGQASFQLHYNFYRSTLLKEDIEGLVQNYCNLLYKMS